MSTARNYIPHYTVEDYQHWEGRWELWEGYPVSMSPSPSGRHGKVLGKIVTGLNLAMDQTQCEATVLVEVDWIVADDTILRPDTMVVCGAEPEMHLQEAPAIVAEVLSPSTRHRDLEWKRETYQQQGVPYYLILDPVENQLTVLHLDSEKKYQSLPASDLFKLQICDDCELEISSLKLFS